MTDLNQESVLKKLKAYLPPHLAKDISTDINEEALLTAFIHITTLRYTLSTYLPSYLVNLIEADVRPSLVSGGFRYGTAMFADVSGFTAMSEKLSALGKEGAEEVTSIVNDYFDTMLEISARHAGDLLKFGGDALLIFFEGEDGPHRALATGEAMQSAMSRFAEVKTSQGTFPLKMSIGAGTGPVFLANLGAGQKMEYTVMGRALSNMARAEDRAVAGQVMVDQATRDAVGDKGRFTEAGDGFWLLDELLAHSENSPGADQPQRPFPKMPESKAEFLAECATQLTILDGLRTFIPAELLKQLIADPQRETVPGSHRPVTVMFANFYGIDEIIEALGPDHEEAITEILNTHFVTMSRILARYAGIVNKVDAYAIGHRIMALFGALQAREDDPQRAVRAALEMNKALAEVNERTREILQAIPDLDFDFGETPLKQRIGLNTGFVFAGNVGSATRREYSVMGDEVNLTARLMGVAKERQVLISQSVVRYLGDEFALEEKEAVKVKGKRAPVRNFVVTGENERPGRWLNIGTRAIIGREAELKRGKATVDKVCAGAGHLLVIRGSSGIGKTRLAEAIVAYGQEQGMDLLAGTCLSYGQTMTYHPWAEILRAYFGFQPSAGSQARIDAVQRKLQAVDEEKMSPIVGELFNLDIPDNDLTRALDAKLRRQRLLDLTLKIVQTHSQARPLILIVEDAHWADPASMGLINYVSRNIQDFPILMILLHRPDDDLPDWTGYDHAVKMSLGDLPAEALLEIVYGMVGQIDLPGSLRDLIIQKGAGNPFFTEEVTRALIDSGALQKDELDKWRVVQDMENVELPDTIHGIIISRIDRLLETDRRLLQVASVVGATFSSDIVDGVYPYGDFDGTIQNHLDHLDHLGLTEIESVQARHHRFKHLTTREVVYESQAFGQRRSLHCRIGMFVERLAQAISEEIDLLAYHYFEGQDWRKAMEYNLLAARQAQKKFANATAIAAYQRILQAAAKLKVNTEVEELLTRESLGEVFTLLGRYDEALEHYDMAQKMVEAEIVASSQTTPNLIDQTRHLAELCRKTADVYEKRSEYETALEWMDKGLSYLQEDKVTIEAARIYLLGAGVYHRQGKNDNAIAWCKQSLQVAMKIKTHEGQQAVGNAYYLLGFIYSRRGDLRRAVRFCRQSVEVYQKIEDIVGLSQAYINLANAYSDQGDWERASGAFRHSLAMKEQIGDIFYQGVIANNLANIHLDRGQWSQARELFRQSNAVWKQLGATGPEAITLSNLAQVNIYQENWAEARACLERSQTLFSHVGSEEYAPELERRWGELYLRTNDLERALTHTQRSIDLAVKQKARLEEGMSYRILGQIRLVQRDWPAAEADLQKSLNILNELNTEYQAAKTTLSVARLFIARGSTPAARAQLQQTIAAFEKLGAQADLAKAKKLWGQLA